MSHLKVQLYSDIPPTHEQEQRFKQFIKNKYNVDVSVEWIMDPKIKGGFKLKIGTEVFDWSKKGLFKQFSDAIDSKKYIGKDTIPLIKDTLNEFELSAMPEETGIVITVGDGIAELEGLQNVTFGEIVVFEGGVRGMVQNLRDDRVGCILFDDNEEVRAGGIVRRTGKRASIPAGEEFLGRVINALGVPIDGKGKIKEEDYYPIEAKAPGIIDRQPVTQPLYTGILAIDSMFPIGRGQRELIIGDRQTGKTAIALDTIINQKGKDCICIYVAIGQKAGTVANYAKVLKDYGAMDYTVILAANASDSDPMQYIAPYAGCALAEYFMDRGRDVLIVYDDLSKHAVAYRAISLLLERSPGREAYPGDIFYLHSRLLERSAHLSEEKGGGSMTALPIIETQDGDVSAYIPTNVISITDGQIYLETNLFFSGQRPAVNVGLSVSRVGGDAQTQAIKKAVSGLRFDLAQYRDMEVFTKFSSDMDESTRDQLSYGRGLMRMLRQDQYKPYSLHRQVIILVAAMAHCMEKFDEDDVPAYLKELIDSFEAEFMDLCTQIDRNGELDDEEKRLITEFAEKIAVKYIPGDETGEG